MRLYLVEWYDCAGYDTYSEFIVACSTPDEARNTYPGGRVNEGWEDRVSSWIKHSQREQLRVTYLGRAKKDLPAGVLIASYHAG